VVFTAKGFAFRKEKGQSYNLFALRDIRVFCICYFYIYSIFSAELRLQTLHTVFSTQLLLQTLHTAFSTQLLLRTLHTVFSTQLLIQTLHVVFSICTTAYPDPVQCLFHTVAHPDFALCFFYTDAHLDSSIPLLIPTLLSVFLHSYSYSSLLGLCTVHTVFSTHCLSRLCALSLHTAAYLDSAHYLSMHGLCHAHNLFYAADHPDFADGIFSTAGQPDCSLSFLHS
jgi:hypothetical protein